MMKKVLDYALSAGYRLFGKVEWNHIYEPL